MGFDFFGLFRRKATPDSFAKLVQRELRANGVTGEITYDAEKFEISAGAHRMFLGNSYDYYVHTTDKERRRTIVQNFIGPILATKEEFGREEALELAVSVIRETALITLGNLHWQSSSSSPPAFEVALERVGQWHSRAIVLDFPTHVQMVNREHLEKWELSFDELFEHGRERLKECTIPKFRSENGYFVGTWNDDFDSSRVLLPDLFQDLPIEGNPVFAIPNRLTLMVADSASEQAVEAMLTRAEEICQTEPRPANPSPLTYRNGELVDFTAPADSRLGNAIERITKLTTLGYYTQQKERLEELYEKDGKDLFVASYKLFEREDGRFRSMCQWSKDVVTLLPVADEVIFYNPDLPEADRIVGTVPWARVAALLGDKMLDTEMFPLRFYVSSFPSDEEIKALLQSA